MEAGPLRNTACKAALGARDDRNLEDILRSFRSSKARRPALLIGGTCQPQCPIDMQAVVGDRIHLHRVRKKLLQPTSREVREFIILS